MRVIEQVKAMVLGLTDEFLIDGSIGTRAISFENLLKAINEKIGWMSLWGDNIPVEARRNTFRGKNLGSTVTQTQWNEIGAGTFRGMFVGDYWEIDDVKWRIVDIDYWWGTGDTPCYTHHLVIMPDEGLTTSYMNEAATTGGGYINTWLRNNLLGGAATIALTAFGKPHLLYHRELLVNAVTDGRPSGGSWVDSNMEIPNEPMMYGSYIITPGSTGTATPYRHTVDKTQLALMQLNPYYINPERQDQWLRDVVSASAFASVSLRGYASNTGASSPLWVRPVFGIRKADD